jgi:catechol 2,3-dioxygenase-like lactoylglutathione lyase family enzyme
LFRVILPVSDIEGATRFYGHVLGLPGQRVSPGRHYFDCEGVILACFDPQADGDGYEALPNPECIYVAVDDLRATFRNVKEAGGLLPEGNWGPEGPKGEIAMRPWGERSFYAEDPFGNQLCFVDRKTMFTG